jgi:uncharacterized membrane protein
MTDELRQPTFEESALTRSEYIMALSHLYRGELQRSISWRIRLDTTTNWAIIAGVGILTFSFQNPGYAPQTLLAGMYANLLFLILESQRFRFSDVYRARVRMVEENFYVPLLRRDLISPMADWGPRVAEDLVHPRFHLSMRQAIRARLARIYLPLYVAQLVGWLSLVAWRRPHDVSFLKMLQIGRLPGWVPLALMVGLFAFMFYIMFFTPRVISLPEFYGDDDRRVGQGVPEIDV